MTSRALPLLTLLLGCRAEDTQRLTSGLDSLDTGLGLTLTGMSGETALQPAARIAHDGLWLSLPDEELHLRTARWGREESLRSVGDAAPRADGCWIEAPGRLAVLGCTPSVVRALPGGVERWRALGEATQQGWTFDEAPAGSGPLLIEVEVLGAELGLDGDTVWLSTVGGQRLRYDSLRAWDDTGVPLQSWMTVDGDRVQIWVDDTDARWPVHVDPILTTATTSITRSTDADFGLGVAMGGNINGDSYVDLIVGARFGVGLYGTAHSYHGGSSGISTTASRSYLSTGYYGKFGEALDIRGDVNNDGYDDAVISEFYNEIIFVYHGSSSGLPSSANTTLYSGSYGAGRNVAWAGDINKDNYDDLVVASEDDVIVYKGSSSGLNTTGVKTHTGTSGFTASGAGDVNNDGYADYIYGDSGANRAYVVLGNTSFTGSSTTLSASGTTYLGETVAGVGDLNNDGYDDVAAADTQYSSNRGRVVVYYGSSSGTRTTGTVTIDGGSTGIYSGGAILGAGDVNGDGYDDMLIGSYGRASLFHGSSTGVSSTATQTITGGGSTFGFTLGGLRTGADINRDGFDDVVIGDFGSKTVYVYYGCQDADGDGECAPTDCNDSNAAVNTSATEVCDASNTDEDCDGLTDDSDSSVSSTGKTRYYKDADSDGYGDKSDSGSLRCDVNSTYKVTTNTDCNDASSAIKPGATEISGDEIDQNCDDAETCFLDNDDDGYRPDSTSTRSSTDLDCTDSKEAKSSDPTGDCNDSSASINPGATETIGDGADQNCDNAETCYVDADNDGYRPDSTSTVASADADCSDSGEALSTEPTGDCADSNATRYPGNTEVVGDGRDSDCDLQEICYIDADNDGFILDSGTVVSTDTDCADSGEGTSTDGTGDCDDTDISVNPDADDQCNDGLDDDCDDIVDEGGASACYAAGDLVITEIMFFGSAVADPAGEWFEVYNDTADTIYMQSMKVTRNHNTNGNQSFYVGTDIHIDAGQYAVFCYSISTLGLYSASAPSNKCDYFYGSSNGFSSSWGATFNSSFLLTQNASSTIVITAQGSEYPSVDLDSVNYNGASSASPWPGGTTGYSYELGNTKRDATSNDTGAHWCNADAASVVFSTDRGTPRAVNVCSK